MVEIKPPKQLETLWLHYLSRDHYLYFAVTDHTYTLLYALYTYCSAMHQYVITCYYFCFILVFEGVGLWWKCWFPGNGIPHLIYSNTQLHSAQHINNLWHIIHEAQSCVQGTVIPIKRLDIIFIFFMLTKLMWSNLECLVGVVPCSFIKISLLSSPSRPVGN